jgi:hypothetical protein
MTRESGIREKTNKSVGNVLVTPACLDEAGQVGSVDEITEGDKLVPGRHGSDVR